MEKIEKCISIEPFKSRFNSKHKFIEIGTSEVKEGENNWGNIHMDAVVDNSNILCNIATKIPLITTNDGVKNVLRYGTLKKWYTWINRFANTTTFKKLCRRKNDYLWVDDESIDFFETSISTYLTTTPNNNEINDGKYSIGDYIGINESADTLNETFRLGSSKVRYELELYKFINSVFEGEIKKVSIPFIELPIFINTNINNLGQYTPYAQLWRGDIEYFIGDVVMHNDEESNDIVSYELVAGNNIVYTNIKGEFINIINTKSEYYDIIAKKEFEKNITGKNYFTKEILFNDNKRIIVKSDDGNFFLPQVSYKSLYNSKKGEFIFNDDESKYWEKNTEYTNDGNNVNINGSVDSYLSSIRRSKVSVDNNGNAMPFIVNDYGDIDTEMFFSAGITNIYFSPNGDIHGDVIKTLKVSNQWEGVELLFENGILNVELFFTTNKQIRPVFLLKLNNKKPILMYKKGEEENESGTTVYYETTFSKGVDMNSLKSISTDMVNYSDDEFKKNEYDFEITYTLGATINDEVDEKIINENTGINYRGSCGCRLIEGGFNYTVPPSLKNKNNGNIINYYDYTLKGNEQNIIKGLTNDTLPSLSYNDIGNIYEIKDGNKNIYKIALSVHRYFEMDNINSSMYSNIDYVPTREEDNFINTSIFKEEALEEIDDIIKDIDVNIERSTAAAYERHSILGEVNTFEDLQNYRNNFFNL